MIFLFAGFLVSIDVFREFRIPFTSIVLGRVRHESPTASAGGRQRVGRDRRRNPRPSPAERPLAAVGPTMAGCRHRGQTAGATRLDRSRQRVALVVGSRRALRDARAAVALRLRRRDGAAGVRGLARARSAWPRRPPSSRGASAAATTGWPAGRPRSAAAGPAVVAAVMGFALNLCDVHRLRPDHGGAGAARLLHLSGDGRRRQRGPRPRPPRPARGSSRWRSRSPAWSRWSRRSSTRRPASGSTRSGSGWRSGRPEPDGLRGHQPRRLLGPSPPSRR